MVSQLFKVASAATAVMLACGLGIGQDNRTAVVAEGIGVSLVLPPGLQQFSEQKMALIREKGIPAKFVFSDSRSDVMVVINTFGSGANEKGLLKVEEGIKTSAQKQNASVEFLKRSVISMNGKKWLRLSLKEETGEDAMIDTYFVTNWAGEYILLNFTATVAKYKSYQGAFETSARSVQLELIVDTTEFNKNTVKGSGKKPSP
ncbi:MAG: hypothetical protein QOI77_2798 [Blastocatellia bacterium]|jgi:hypothetical protein|nr:hypothetical protein [Blastocatellia bacterium]